MLAAPASPVAPLPEAAQCPPAHQPAEAARPRQRHPEGCQSPARPDGQCQANTLAPRRPQLHPAPYRPAPLHSTGPLPLRAEPPPPPAPPEPPQAARKTAAPARGGGHAREHRRSPTTRQQYPGWGPAPKASWRRYSRYPADGAQADVRQHQSSYVRAPAHRDPKVRQRSSRLPDTRQPPPRPGSPNVSAGAAPGLSSRPCSHSPGIQEEGHVEHRS